MKFKIMFLRNKLNPTQEPHINITFFIKAKQAVPFLLLLNQYRTIKTNPIFLGHDLCKDCQTKQHAITVGPVGFGT